MSQPLVHPLRLVFFSKEYTIIIKTRILSQNKTKIQKKGCFYSCCKSEYFSCQVHLDSKYKGNIET